ncbi:phospholipase D family protein [Aureimonas psammosilenae]|uniref:phospholipase D family protein n=1 Tax=Aureimonas psammosilenae TaxID=2495496 RepID=UPI001260520C|nr:phospholipase D family protein [Aureimonas psammosilenae]
MRWVAPIVVGVTAAFAGASAFAGWDYNRFAAKARGRRSTAFDLGGTEPTPIDHRVAELTRESRGRSGLLLLASNLDAFAARALSARSAGRSLDLMYYIWHGDLTGRLLAAEALAAADRGVRVRFLLDDLGVSGDDRVMLALDSHPNIELRLFNPTRARANPVRRAAEMLLRAWSVNRRMHNKAWIVDGRLAIVGGRNVGDEYYDASESSNFRDLDLLCLGPAVTESEKVFDTYWNSGVALPIGKLAKGIVRPRLKRVRAQLQRVAGSREAKPYLDRLKSHMALEGLLDHAAVHWCDKVEIVSDCPEKAAGRDDGNRVMDYLLPVMEAAIERLEITSPYFIPGDRGVESLTELRRRGVQVAVLTNSLAATDVAAVHGGYAPYRKPLLEAGVALFELKPDGRSPSLTLRGSSRASLHTKAFAVDGRHGFIGSLNFDPRSSSLNTEMGILFTSPVLVQRMSELFNEETDPAMSYAVALDEGGKLCWTAEKEGEKSALYESEPDAAVGRRLLATVVGWLPLESQL